MLLGVWRGALHQPARRYSQHADYLAANATGEFYISYNTLQRLIVGHEPTFVLVHVEEHVVANGGAAILRHHLVPALEPGVAGVGEAGRHLLADDLDPWDVQPGGGGDNILQRHLAQEILFLEAV